MNLFKRSSDPNEKLCIWERTAYSFGNFANNLVYTIVSSFLVYFYTTQLGLNGAIIGTILLVSRIFDGVSDLVMGRIVDTTRSRHGKARVWILRMSIPLLITSILMFAVPQGASDTLKYIFIAVSYNLYSTAAYTAMTVPYFTMICTLTNNQYEHGLLGIISTLFSVISAIIVNGVMLSVVRMFGDSQLAWILGVTLFAVIGVVTHLICFFGTRERVENAVNAEKAEPIPLKENIQSLLKNKYWVMFIAANLFSYLLVGLVNSSSVFYASEILGDENLHGTLANVISISQVIFMIVAVPIIAKIGKGKTFRLGIISGTLALITQIILSNNYTALLILNGLKGAGIGLAAACLLGIVADTVEYGEWKTGLRTEGMSVSAVSFSTKVSAGLSSAILGWMLALGKKWDLSAVTAGTGTVQAIKACYLYIPLACCVIILAVMLRYDLDDKYDQILEDLKARRSSGKGDE